MISIITLKRILVKTRLLELPVYYFKKNPIYNFLRFGYWTNQYLPEIIYLETTNACNAKCYSCPRAKMDRPIGVMTWEVFTKIVTDLKKLKRLYFVLHIDGEPLLDPQLFNRIKYLKQNLINPHIHFNTNAELMTPEKSQQILNSGLDSITFSVDGTTKETYEQVKTGLNFEKTISNINNFFLLKREGNYKYPKVTMQMVVNETNQHQISEYRQLWKNKANRIFIKAMLNFLVQGTSIKTKELSPRQLRRCFQPISVFAIYWDGRVGLCCWDYNHLAKLDSITNKSIIEIFNAKPHQIVRKAMLKMSCQNIVPCNFCSQIYGHDMNSDYKK
ncbi:MAG: radical SAM/SPASM domain-containing protein [Candidatus Buchananbacteria bacterium]